MAKIKVNVFEFGDEPYFLTIEKDGKEIQMEIEEWEELQHTINIELQQIKANTAVKAKELEKRVSDIKGNKETGDN